uniref:Uncharacterized protein n=1 Tax=Eptatretus burgeri TaxID=7764 RepID=A0A8C4QUN3_EPTBU
MNLISLTAAGGVKSSFKVKGILYGMQPQPGQPFLTNQLIGVLAEALSHLPLAEHPAVNRGTTLCHSERIVHSMRTLLLRSIIRSERAVRAPSFGASERSALPHSERASGPRSLIRSERAVRAPSFGASERSALPHSERASGPRSLIRSERAVRAPSFGASERSALPHSERASGPRSLIRSERAVRAPSFGASERSALRGGGGASDNSPTKACDDLKGSL